MWASELNEHTSFLYAYGALDRASVQWALWPNAMTTAGIRAGDQRFHSRDDEWLGEGYSIDGEVGAQVLTGKPSLHLRLQGGMQANSLPDHIPSGLAVSSGIPQNTPVGSLLTQQLGQFGWGFRLGLPAFDRETWKLDGFIDGWMGGLWPAGEFACHFRGGIDTSFFGFDQLSAEAPYANTQGGQEAQPYDGVQVSYRLRF